MKSLASRLSALAFVAIACAPQATRGQIGNLPLLAALPMVGSCKRTPTTAELEKAGIDSIFIFESKVPVAKYQFPRIRSATR